MAKMARIEKANAIRSRGNPFATFLFMGISSEKAKRPLLPRDRAYRIAIPPLLRLIRYHARRPSGMTRRAVGRRVVQFMARQATAHRSNALEVRHLIRVNLADVA